MSRSTDGGNGGLRRVAARSVAFGIVAFLVANQLFATTSTTGLYVAGAAGLVSLAAAARRRGGSDESSASAVATASSVDGDEGNGRVDPEIEAELETLRAEVGRADGTRDPAESEPAVEAAGDAPVVEPTTDPEPVDSGSGTPAVPTAGAAPADADSDDDAADGSSPGSVEPTPGRNASEDGPDDERVAALLETATEATRRARRRLAGGDYAGAVDGIEEGFDVCSRAIGLADRGTGRHEAATDARAELLSLVESGDAEVSVAARAADLRREAEAAIEDGDLAGASRSLGELERLLAAASDVELPQSRLTDVVDPLRDDAADLEGRLTDAAESRVDEALAAAEAALDEGRRLAECGKPESAVLDRIETGREHCERAAGLARTHGASREDEVADVRVELDDLADRVAARSELVTTAEDRMAAARRASRANDLGAAEEALEDAERMLEELAANGAPGAVLDPLRSEAEEVAAGVAIARARSSVLGSLGSAGAAVSKAESLLESGERDRARRRLESALETIERAETLNGEHGLDRDDALAAKRGSVEALLDEARARPAEELASSLEAGETAASRGGERREAGDLVAAVEAFEEAHRTYEEALELAERFELAERWEVEQRRSMLAGYAETAREERDERRRSVETDLGRQLENAGAALDRAEQHAEVDDHVSARESLGSAVRNLEEAARLVDTGLAGDGPTARYESLVARADALHGRLPAKSETGTYRTRDLVASLQSLATELGESPRPEFVNAYGDHPADAYLEAFGSWPEALAAANLDPVDEAARERRTYSRVEVLDALAELAAELGRPPSKGEMNARGSMSASPVDARFADWETALELAGVTEGVDDDPDDGSDDDPDGDRDPVRREPDPSGTDPGPDVEPRPSEGSETSEGDAGTSGPASGDDDPEDVLGAIERELGSFAERTGRGDADS